MTHKPQLADWVRLGLLTLVHRIPGRYGSESQSMPAAFASYAAVAIENARLYETAQEQAWISAVLLKVAEATQSLTTRECRLPYLWPSPEPCCGRRL